MIMYIRCVGFRVPLTSPSHGGSDQEWKQFLKKKNKYIVVAELRQTWSLSRYDRQGCSAKYSSKFELSSQSTEQSHHDFSSSIFFGGIGTWATLPF